jgi:hypothetical protein
MPEAGGDGLVASEAGSDGPTDASEAGGLSCTGPYQPAAPGSLPFCAGCSSGPALISCKYHDPAPFVGVVSCFQNERSKRECGMKGEYDCVNACAPGEYAVLCSDTGGTNQDTPPFDDPSCHLPIAMVQPLSSVKYLCCTCGGE